MIVAALYKKIKFSLYKKGAGMNNSGQLQKIDAPQINNKENVKILEIGKVTELTFGNQHYDYERIRYYSDGSCVILKK